MSRRLLRRRPGGWRGALLALAGCTSTTTVTTTAVGSDGDQSRDRQRPGRRRAPRQRAAGTGRRCTSARGQASDGARRGQAGARRQARPARGLQPARPDLRRAGRGRSWPKTSFRRALQLNPRDGDAMHNYGWFLCQQRPLRRGRRAVRARAGAAAVPRDRAHPAGAGRVPGARRPVGAGRAHAVAQLRARPRQSRHRPTTWARCCCTAANSSARASTSSASMRGPTVQRADPVAGGAHRAPPGQPATPCRLYGRQLRDRFPQSTETAAVRTGPLR